MPRRSSRSSIPQIPLEIWRPLYAAADSLRELALWEELGDAELLGVDHPRTGEAMLGVTMGALGEVFGLSLHHGAEGLRFVLETALNPDDEPDMEEFHRMSVLKVEFVAKGDLAPEEKHRVKEINFRPAPVRPLLWPNFESVHPGHMPWHLDLAEAELLLHALPRLNALGACLREFYEGGDVWPDGQIAFWPREREPGEPLRMEEIDWRRLPVPPRVDPEPLAEDEATEAALKRLPQSPGYLLELDATSGLGVIDEGERPWLIKTGVAAEAQSGMILGLEMGSTPEEGIETIAGRVFVQALQRVQMRPAAVRVRQVRIQKALGSICARLGIQLALQRELPAVAEFQAATAKRFGS